MSNLHFFSSKVFGFAIIFEQIGICLRAAPSENILKQWGHLIDEYIELLDWTPLPYLLFIDLSTPPYLEIILRSS
jgi:hypothetical protein